MNNTVLRNELQAIYDDHGALTPSVVLNEAEDATHPLHSEFTWDDSLGAHKWRLHEAHKLIQSVRITYRTPTRVHKDVRAFMAVSAQDRNSYTYEPVERVLESDIMTEIVFRNMRRDWDTFKARYENFVEFREMIIGDLGVESA